MPVKTLKTNKFTWLNINKVNSEDLDFLRKNYRFHPLNLTDCLGAQRPKLDIYKNYLFLVFQYPSFNKGSREIQTKQLNVFIGKDFLITVYEGEYKQLRNFFYRNKSNTNLKTLYKKGSGYLLYRILFYLFNYSLPPIVDYIDKQLSSIEKDIFGEKTKNVHKNMAMIRRDIMNFRRILEPQVMIINNLVHLKKTFWSQELSDYFDDIHDSLEKNWFLLENFKDYAQNLHETRESLISQRTNEVIKILTVISVALLPLTLFAGIYGMNIGGLPFADHPSGVWVVFGVMFLIILGSLFYLVKKDWI